MITKLTEEQFKSTMSLGMQDVTETAEAPVDIWPHVKHLVEQNVVEKYVFENELVELVYRNSEGTIDHVLLPTPQADNFIVIVVVLTEGTILGYYPLDLRKEYGIT